MFNLEWWLLEDVSVVLVYLGSLKINSKLILLTDMAREAVTATLDDAGISYQDVEAVVASYCYGEPTSGK